MSTKYPQHFSSNNHNIYAYIQDFYSSKSQFILDFISYSLNLYTPNTFQLPTLSISDKAPIKTYKTYDYHSISKAIKSFREKDTDYKFGNFNSILADIQGTIRDLQNGYRFENHKDNFSSLLNHLERMLAEAPSSPELDKVQKIYTSLTTPKRIFYRLGEYNPQNNTITLYPRSILKHFGDVPREPEELKLFTGAEITLTRALFLATYFNLMGATDLTRNKYWNCRTKDNPLRESVVEGLATYIEYNLCSQKLYQNEVFKWQKEYIEKDVNANDYPVWSCSAAKAFIYKGKLLEYNAIKVFNTSIQQTSTHWQDAYALLKDLDSQIKRPKTFREAVEELL